MCCCFSLQISISLVIPGSTTEEKLHRDQIEAGGYTFRLHKDDYILYKGDFAIVLAYNPKCKYFAPTVLISGMELQQWRWGGLDRHLKRATFWWEALQGQVKENKQLQKPFKDLYKSMAECRKVVSKFENKKATTAMFKNVPFRKMWSSEIGTGPSRHTNQQRWLQIKSRLILHLKISHQSTMGEKPGAGKKQSHFLQCHLQAQEVVAIITLLLHHLLLLQGQGL